MACAKNRNTRSVCASFRLGLLAGEQVELAGDLIGSPGEGGVVDAAGEFGCVRGLD
ncbi:Uncharacterised protein [Mycobacterium tuberculosis]|uniref:Uncharacterized protein n=1 Tax=Mycobacterium tuberculosis TaxID=1773 RepID=A0A0U0T187_MYCTX|nr:Uncharacterised protein [Mycobacterium tuberculosis]COZ88939.1 Uncharacterised protein [Mycobacterium tuberculosis]